MTETIVPPKSNIVPPQGGSGTPPVGVHGRSVHYACELALKVLDVTQEGNPTTAPLRQKAFQILDEVLGAMLKGD